MPSTYAFIQLFNAALSRMAHKTIVLKLLLYNVITSKIARYPSSHFFPGRWKACIDITAQLLSLLDALEKCQNILRKHGKALTHLSTNYFQDWARGSSKGWRSSAEVFGKCGSCGCGTCFEWPQPGNHPCCGCFQDLHHRRDHAQCQNRQVANRTFLSGFHQIHTHDWFKFLSPSPFIINRLSSATLGSALCETKCRALSPNCIASSILYSSQTLS